MHLEHFLPWLCTCGLNQSPPPWWILKSGSRLPGGWAGQRGASLLVCSLRISQPLFICQLDKLHVFDRKLSSECCTNFALFISVLKIKLIFKSYLYKIIISTEITNSRESEVIFVYIKMSLSYFESLSNNSTVLSFLTAETKLTY